MQLFLLLHGQNVRISIFFFSKALLVLPAWPALARHDLTARQLWSLAAAVCCCCLIGLEAVHPHEAATMQTLTWMSEDRCLAWVSLRPLSPLCS